jgi:hypothetical protein
MAGAATQTITLTVTGIGDSLTFTNTKAMTVPVACQHGYTVLSTATTTALQLFAMVDHIALTKIYGVYLKAEVGTVYILVDTAGTTTFAAAAADLVLNAGEACYLPINPAGNLGLCIDGSAVTAAISWAILGQT